MEFALARMWWALALRGVLAILFGVMAFFWPQLLWLVVVALFAIYAFLDGVIAIAAAALWFTPQGRDLLAKFGIATADHYSDCSQIA